jgi:hypothetical protein
MGCEIDCDAFTLETEILQVMDKLLKMELIALK